MIAVTQRHNAARLAGTLADLDAGTGSARLRLYGGTRPATPNEAPASELLVEIVLTKPAGTIADGALTLTAVEDGLIQTSGLATWARFVTGDDATAFDADAGEGPGPWEVQLVTTQLYAGGNATLVSAVLT